jgi:tetratricopeptide (TPR) repeat protein
VELFLERAAAVGADIPVTPENLAVLGEICSRLDGLPLAIELAASRVKHMSIGQLNIHLDHRLQPLVGGARDLPPRQQTMRGALDWSYALLGAPEMSLFRSLSVLRGSFGLDAVNWLTSSSGAPGGPDALTALSNLVDSSLVQAETGVAGETRYRMLDVVREYAVERAQSAGDLDQLRERHADHFLAVGERHESQLRGSEQQQAYRRLLEDEGNFRAALTWALGADHPEIALRLAGALWMFWRWAGLFAEGRGWLETALAACDECPPATRLQALWGAGWLAYQQGDYRRTAHVGQEMLELVGDVDEGIHRRNALTLVGNASLAEGRGADAVSALSVALAICEGHGRSWHLGTSLLNLGTALLYQSHADEARPMFERALEIYEELGDQHFTARTLLQLGYAALTRGDREAAAAAIERAMNLATDLGDAWSLVEVLEAIADLVADESPRTTAVLGGAAERLREQISIRQHPADAIINESYVGLARARLQPGEFEAAWSEGRYARTESALATGVAAMHSSQPPESRLPG